ncbi:DUF2492 family protein [Sediminitomix flava]|uniref:Putative metal-binding protein n=1 Tax=Sediminitomix flava TaxID=379075 RepID=A0A315Z888_SEDFL|nr:DUF2492 family protein [Sediminitomix flava]PWJ41077.1 putative metal-binding protein [Sediminitomix flava]
MENTVHVHEVIFMIGDQKGGHYNNASLIEDIKGKWGAEVNFMACSGVPFPPQDVVPFLMERSKIVLDDNGNISLHPNMQICNGHEKH